MGEQVSIRDWSLATLCLTLLLAGCGGAPSAVTADKAARAQKVTCQVIAERAVEISQGEKPELVKVHKPKVKVDHTTTYKKPTGDKAALVMSCSGTAVWSSGATSPVLLRYTVDADGDTFVSYKEQ